ncbi:MAG: glycosyltransferase family 4 protein [Bythopirellula sp.]|nr:glycosyltransferase family 4 protein [Bythopirellula sp.]
MTATLQAPNPPASPAIATRRVLHVINGEHYSGAERVQDLLAEELPHCGFEVSFACVKPDRFAEVRHYQQATLYQTPMRGRFDWKCGHELAKLIRREDFALVHAHTPRSLLAGAIAAREAGVPLVYHVHSPTGNDSTRRLQNFVNARLERWLLRRAAKLIAVSPSLAELMIRQGFAQERVVYVPNGVPAVKSIIRHRPTSTWTLGMAALFRPRKGIEVLLQALSLLRSQGYDVRLRAIGPFETPAYEREVHALVAQLNIADAIDWTGFVSDVHAELRQVDLFVLPSLFGEGLPMVVLEAMAAGLPVVASNVEGIPAAIRDGEEGLLVEPNHPEKLAAAISEMVKPGSRHDYAAMCQNTRERHAAQFSATAMAANVARVYRDVLD